MISWEAHERYLQKLFNHLRGDAPENFSKTTLQQVLNADRQVFLEMIKNDVAVRRQLDNTLQMDTAIVNALGTYEVGFHIIPLPKIPKTTHPAPPTYVPTRNQQSYNEAPYPKKGHKGKAKERRESGLRMSSLRHFRGETTSRWMAMQDVYASILI